MASYLDTSDLGQQALQPTPVQDRPYLLLEDLLDDPIEWTLCDVNAQSAGQAATGALPVAIH